MTFTPNVDRAAQDHSWLFQRLTPCFARSSSKLRLVQLVSERATRLMTIATHPGARATWNRRKRQLPPELAIQ